MRAKDQKLRVKLAAILSTQETLDLKSDAKQLEEELGDQALSSLRKSALEGQDEVQKQHKEELKKVESEN